MRKLLFVLLVALLAGSAEAGVPYWFGVDYQPADTNSYTDQDFTYIRDEAATFTGYIDSIQVYFNTCDATPMMQFAVFNKTPGATTFRDTVVTQEWTPATGAGLQTLNLVDNEGPMLIHVGQYLGFWLETSGTAIYLEKSTDGGPGYYYSGSDAIDSTVSDNSFTLSGNTTHDIQIRAYVTDAGVAGPRSPTAASGLFWTNPTYVYSSDDSRADFTSTTSKQLITEDYGFELPAPPAGNDTLNVTLAVDSINATVEGWANGFNATSREFDCWLTKNGTTTRVGDKDLTGALPGALVGNEAVVTVSGNGLWNTTWTRAEINKSDGSGFGFIIDPIDAASSTQYHIDHTTLTVYYHYDSTLIVTGRPIIIMGN